VDKTGFGDQVNFGMAVYFTQPNTFRITDQRGNFSASAAPPNIQCL
jgi:hypothetical protein